MPRSQRHAEFIRLFKRHIEEKLLWRPEPDPAERERGTNLEAIAAEVATCLLCGLAGHRQRAVAGQGALDATLLIIVPAPDEAAETDGDPCGGAPGALLEKMLTAIAVARKETFITPIVKCRTPDGRAASAEEIAACRGYLERQIALIRPRAILALGVAMPDGLETPTIPVFATHHPAHLLAHPAAKKAAWDVLQRVRAALDAG